MFGDRPWGPGNSPKIAVVAYLNRLGSESRNGIDGVSLDLWIYRNIDRKLLVSVAPDGFLRRWNIVE